MKLILNFILSICIFIYGMQLFSNSLGNIKDHIKNILENYTKTIKSSIILGTIVTSIVQSSSLITSITVGLVNSNIITFHNSIGIMMGANLGTCITSWLTAFLCINTTNQPFFLNINNYTPIILCIGLIMYFKNKTKLSNILVGYAFFILGLSMLQTSLTPIMEYKFFKDIISSFNNPLLGLFIGIITTTLIQSSSATIAILQTISNKTPLNYYMTIPIILGENIGSCATTLIASIGTKKNAKKVAFSHLFYNIIGTIVFIIFFYLSVFFNFNYLKSSVDSKSIALIHTLFNFFSIIIFKPFINNFENFINKMIK